MWSHYWITLYAPRSRVSDMKVSRIYLWLCHIQKPLKLYWKKCFDTIKVTFRRDVNWWDESFEKIKMRFTEGKSLALYETWNLLFKESGNFPFRRKPFLHNELWKENMQQCRLIQRSWLKVRPLLSTEKSRRQNTLKQEAIGW